ncbi:polysaccharide pyruvyl transferase family protein [Saccharicrinis aurantiacus]|uniref:polysaccharide pyruvyl transferase family protein n=1 Tax=Saccharicrinis aurantiacus TaxID=1849719 RepID=UPI0024904D47|nr:polysaccharide pyruvyl transferase family protein [Saccharicrinis aurantiacus]
MNITRKYLAPLIKYIFHKHKPVVGYVTGPNFGDALNIPLFKLCFGWNAESNPFLKRYFSNYIFIGSIIERGNNKSIILGAGIIKEDEILNYKPKKVISVRGKLSRNILLKNKIECPEVYGDPALLLPLFYSTPRISKYKIGIIPHFKDANLPLIKELSMVSDIKIIDILCGKNYKKFINDIHECDIIVSSSLHGIIVSDAYNTPNVWCEFSDNVEGNGFKFHDYFSSVNIKRPLLNAKDLSIHNFFKSVDKITSTYEPIQFDSEKYLNYLIENIK